MTNNTDNKINADTAPMTGDVSSSVNTNTGNQSNRPNSKFPFKKNSRFGSEGKDRGSRRSGGPRGERVKPEFDTKSIDVKRVARVVSGGRRFSFWVAMVAGNRKGSVGVGIGKGSDTALAIEKATKNAKRNMITVPLTKEGSIAHDVFAKYNSREAMVVPAKGRGLVAGSSVRNVLELAGVKDVMGKIMSGSKNKLNNARATVEALKKLKQVNQK